MKIPKSAKFTALSPFKSAKEQDAQIASLKVPPHSVEAEQSVLGGLMLDNNAWDRVAEKVVKGDFYLRQHKQIFAAMASLMIKNHPIDLITVSEALEKDKIKISHGPSDLCIHCKLWKRK